jgi:hypothetical protein
MVRVPDGPETLSPALTSASGQKRRTGYPRAAADDRKPLMALIKSPVIWTSQPNGPRPTLTSPRPLEVPASSAKAPNG